VGDIIINKNDTFIDGIRDLTAHITALKEEATEDSLHRASRLNTKTARYFVGAPSESALSYRRLKVEDAISAAYQALNGGIVPGAGSVLAHAIPEGDSVGALILKEALLAPMLQIRKNAGLSFVNPPQQGMGYDTRTKQYVNLIDAGIVDPTNVALNAVRNAISVAATILSAPTIVTFPEDDKATL
jgi:chaperonin GroEL